jgi:hypothetical protein
MGELAHGSFRSMDEALRKLCENFQGMIFDPLLEA